MPLIIIIMAEESYAGPMETFLKGIFVEDNMAIGQMFLVDVNLNLAAEFSGGDAICLNCFFQRY